MTIRTLGNRITQSFSASASTVAVRNDPNGGGFFSSSSNNITINTVNVAANGYTLTSTTPTISRIQVTDSNYIPLDDTAISTSGGYITITGTNFRTGVVVYIGTSAAISTTFVSATQLNVQVPSNSGGTVQLLVVNSDSTAYSSSITYSSFPTWITGSTLTSFVSNTAYSTTLSATSDSAITYSLVSGSLPPNSSLAANGYFSGNTYVTSVTNYSFTVAATDQENQNTNQTFSIQGSPLVAFTISPAVNGKTIWNMATDGTLTLTNSGTYVISGISNDFTTTVKMWGGGGGGGATGFPGVHSGGAGGAATGTIQFWANTSYDLIVAQGGFGATVNLSRAGGGGGSGSGIRIHTVNTPILVAGGGGGGGVGGTAGQNAGGAGGGTNGQNGFSGVSNTYGIGGSQSAAGGVGPAGRIPGSPGSGSNGGNGGGATSTTYISPGTGYGTGGYGAQDTNDAGGGGGGAGYFGGGGGGDSTGAYSVGGGGGSGYQNTTYVTGGTLYAGNGTTPGNSADGSRGTAGNAGGPGASAANGSIIVAFVSVP